MGSIIGFSLFDNLDNKTIKQLLSSQEKVLSTFNYVECKSIYCGTAQLEVWGHGEISEQMYRMPDGSLLVLVGSPHNQVVWLDVQDGIISDNFELPWEGRVILLQISADGHYWKMWNDWLGSIPVFYTEVGRGRVASTLEPVTVAAAGYTPDDFFLPGLVSLLINGHFISDWTLYKDMKVIPPDSVVEWGEKGLISEQAWSVIPSRSRWEAGWDDLVDEMYELSHQAIANVLKTRSKWVLPLSSGLDSRLIAGVAADIGTDAHAYTWGGDNTTDAVNSQRIAKILGFPWKRIELPKDFMVTYTPHWANWFGSAMHFHGMYQMAFLNEIRSEQSSSIISGYIGDVLAGDSVKDLSKVHSAKRSYQLEGDWYCHWTADEVRSHAKFSFEDALEANADQFKKQIETLPGAWYQKLQFLELWNRQRFFTSFQSIISDYWHGVANPFMNREYASFCMSLPRVALDNRRLLADVFRRYYGRLAVIPGTYAQEPYILTGRYLILRKMANVLPPAFHRGPLRGLGNVQLRMDIASLQSSGRDALQPLFRVLDRLSEWVDINQLEQDYQTVMKSDKDMRPLRRLQSIQALAHRLT